MNRYAKISCLFVLILIGTVRLTHAMDRSPRKRARIVLTHKEPIGGRTAEDYDIHVSKICYTYIKGTEAPDKIKYSFELINRATGTPSRPDLTFTLEVNNTIAAAGIQKATLTVDPFTAEQSKLAKEMLVYLIEFLHNNHARLSLGKRIKLHALTPKTNDLLTTLFKDAGFKQTVEEDHLEWDLLLIIE